MRWIWPKSHILPIPTRFSYTQRNPSAATRPDGLLTYLHRHGDAPSSYRRSRTGRAAPRLDRNSTIRLRVSSNWDSALKPAISCVKPSDDARAAAAAIQLLAIAMAFSDKAVTLPVRSATVCSRCSPLAATCTKWQLQFHVQFPDKPRSIQVLFERDVDRGDDLLPALDFVADK